MAPPHGNSAACEQTVSTVLAGKRLLMVPETASYQRHQRPHTWVLLAPEEASNNASEGARAVGERDSYLRH